jgi:homeobox protein cut-like
VQELASHNAEVQAQMCKIAQELAEYKAESKDLKNQDGTIRRLEERVRSLEAQLQEKVDPFPITELSPRT